MVVNPAIKEKISINLRDVNVFEALDTVREIYGYEYKVQGNRILIQPLTMQTRMFQINYLYNQRKGKSELRVSSGAISDSAGSTQSGATTATTGPQGVTTQNLQSSRIETTTELNFWGDLASGVRAIIGAAEGRNVIVNAESGVVLVRAMPGELREVDNFLHADAGRRFPPSAARGEDHRSAAVRQFRDGHQLGCVSQRQQRQYCRQGCCNRARG